LARKGVKTAYLASKDKKSTAKEEGWAALGVRSQYERTKYARLLEQERGRAAKEKRSSEIVIGQISAGNLSAVPSDDVKSLVGKVYVDGVWRAPNPDDQTEVERGVTIADVDAIKKGVGVQLVERARLGEAVDNKLLEQMTPMVKKQVQDLQKEVKRGLEGSGKRFAREVGRSTLESAEDKAASLKEKAFRTDAEVRRDQLKKAAEEEQLRKMEESVSGGSSLLPQKDFDAPFLDESYGGPFTNPLLAPAPPALGAGTGKVERLQAFDVFDRVAEGKAGPSFGDVVQKEVDSLFGARYELGKVDKTPFAKGKKSFEKGDFEGVTAALAEMADQKKQQEQRRNVVYQTRQLVDSPQNRQAQLRAEPGVGTFMFSGGNRIADQTRKVAKVHEAVQKGYSEAATREAVLRQMVAQLQQKPAVPEAVSPLTVDVVKNQKPSVWSEVGGQFLGGE
jgi:hypothetical protein